MAAAVPAGIAFVGLGADSTFVVGEVGHRIGVGCSFAAGIAARLDCSSCLMPFWELFKVRDWWCGICRSAIRKLCR